MRTHPGSVCFRMLLLLFSLFSFGLSNSLELFLKAFQILIRHILQINQTCAGSFKGPDQLVEL